MKTFTFLAAVAAFSTVAISTPASACNGYQARDGSCGSSANRYNEEAAARSRASNGYRSYDGGDSLLGAVIDRTIFGNPYQSHKPKDGELRTFPSGVTAFWDKKKRTWVVVDSPATQPRGVVVTRDVYVAN